ncbi:ImmA/IrrE family metallo-endopeptidase [Novosphingobium sp. NDB2Meth1]|uniref:ImmA/IrrE family metallo-endopeptidase n=1 Tax=Novosphingobium sp. NDB2Meth1 TaxID=1892847 RepID=UPI0009311AE9|nr:ImmA/IrrE family metallo-endopeptidase [Novosphingobium sp. NDB2Meth1]
MTIVDVQRQEKDWFSRPGDSVLSAMRRRGVSAEALSGRLAGGITQLRDLMSGFGAIDDATADALSGMLGGSTTFWKTRQAKYREALAQAVNLLSDEEADAWLDRIPAPGSKGRITVKMRSIELERRLAYFGVSTLKSWDARYGPHQREARFRRSLAFTQHDGATSMWLREGELNANLRQTATWSSDALRARLGEIRALSRISKPNRFMPPLVKLLADAGVALVVVKAPKGCRASGASRMIAPDKAMILMSFRHRADDHFWFTLFHEIGHLLLHEASSFVDIEGMEGDDPCEKEANEFATAIIVPQNREAELLSIGPDDASIRRFAVSLGVAPGLILGQLQHRGIVNPGALRRLRRIWTWEQIQEAI